MVFTGDLSLFFPFSFIFVLLLPVWGFSFETFFLLLFSTCHDTWYGWLLIYLLANLIQFFLPTLGKMGEYVVLTSQSRDKQDLWHVRQDPGERDVLINHPRGGEEERAERKVFCAPPQSASNSGTVWALLESQKMEVTALPLLTLYPCGFSKLRAPPALQMQRTSQTVLLRPQACVHLFLLPGMNTTALFGETFYDPAHGIILTILWEAPPSPISVTGPYSFSHCSFLLPLAQNLPGGPGDDMLISLIWGWALGGLRLCTPRSIEWFGTQ